jgi:DNA-binding transcriptional regulator YiaG
VKGSHHYFHHPSHPELLACVPVHPGNLKRPSSARSFARPASPLTSSSICCDPPPLTDREGAAKDEPMGTTLKDKMARLAPERRARIEAEADRLHAEYQTLNDLRKARDLTQAQLAETLGIRQATVAQLEKRSDLMFSTLRSYVEAMGGASGSRSSFPTSRRSRSKASGYRRATPTPPHTGASGGPSIRDPAGLQTMSSGYGGRGYVPARAQQSKFLNFFCLSEKCSFQTTAPIQRGLRAFP